MTIERAESSPNEAFVEDMKRKQETLDLNK
jgi:hypothetical protein